MRILITLVRYKMSLAESETIAGLCHTFDKYPELLDTYMLVIWDNSPLPLDNPQLPIPFLYRHTSENLGVSGAYNGAMAIAESLGCPWLLLLDQDTTLPDTFLPRMLEYSREQEGNQDIAAVAPFLLDRDRTVSPVIVYSNRFKLMSMPFNGVHPKEVYAANSGTLMRVSSLRMIGGYDENFWLDLSDVVAFHQLYQKGKRLYIAGDLLLQHESAIYDYDRSMSPERYHNFIAAEGAYWDLYRTFSQNSIQTVRLFARLIRQYLRYKCKEYSLITWRYFCERLFTRKVERLRRWKQQSLHRDIPKLRKPIVY